jgi:choline dehydrogenase-like flavoprotein
MKAEEWSLELQAAIQAATSERVQAPRGFDAIVVGAGAAGGMAALLLTEAGMSVLLLDAGWRPRFRDAPLRQTTAAIVKRVADPRLQSMLPAPVVRLGRKALRAAGHFHQPVQTKCFAWEMAPDAFVDDKENPYVNAPGTRFDWFRARQIGGRMTIPGHGRQYYRLTEHDLSPEDNLSPRWPVPSAELSHWYDVVEQRLGLSAGREDCPWVPGGQPSNLRVATPAEAEAIATLKARWPDVHPILGRSAPPLPSAEMAAATGRLVCRQGAIVRDVRVGPDGRAAGVSWVDHATGRDMSARAPIVFVCASALESTRILLLSRSAFGDPIGARSGALGTCLMDHVFVWAEGTGGALAGEPEPLVPGRCVYLPRFDLRMGRESSTRGFGVQIYRWSLGSGRSHFRGVSHAEMTPRAENHVMLDFDRTDAWGLPVLRIACRHNETELERAKDQSAALREVGDALGVQFHRLVETPAPPGTAVHECGTARMGDSPDHSVLDPDNQCWDAKGVYVTDASAFPSQGVQNPTLTILALTARACAHATGSWTPKISQVAP